ncbi:MAG: ROK family transcriptional regulator [Parvibaculum sp.]|uniref:ROK family transcriptional regulator n=1 Tax=Parvibaculum sp. TaxID=2024848 RepID=UPI0025D72910|nr:ROK family transcriptional regulator [Parvibaculum sp.]MCE9650679.1 ROK family transcriptional regulator [Parvibaculum sp.]
MTSETAPWPSDEISGHGLSGTNLEHARDHNQRVTLQAIRFNGPLSRLDLARITGLTLPSIANITKRLLETGLIVEETQRQGKRGQPAKQIAINPDGCYSLGINIDRDHIDLAVVDFAGRVRAQVKEEIGYAAPETAVAFIRRKLPELLASGGIGRQKLIGAGVAIPDELGRLEPPSQRPDSYREWQNADIRELMAEELSLPIFVENDAAAAAIGELQFGDGAKAGSYFYIFIGVGLGGGLVLNGSSFRGGDGRSGEIGFLPVASTDPKVHCLADIVSIAAIHDRLAARDIHVAEPGDLLNLDASGTEVIETWLDEATSHLTDVLASITCLINPDTVFIGGRLPLKLAARLTDMLNKALAARMTRFPFVPQIRAASRAEDAAVLGAAVLPMSALFLPNETALLKSQGPVR